MYTTEWVTGEDFTEKIVFEVECGQFEAIVILGESK